MRSAVFKVKFSRAEGSGTSYSIAIGTIVVSFGFSPGRV